MSKEEGMPFEPDCSLHWCWCCAYSTRLRSAVFRWFQVKLVEDDAAKPRTHVVRPLLERSAAKGGIDGSDKARLPKAGMARWTP